MPRNAAWVIVGAVVLTGVGRAGTLDGQIRPPPTPPPSPMIADTGVAGEAAADTLPKRPVSPMGAFLRSLVLPGWGQAKLDRKLTGGVFIVWEGVTLAMSIKASHELGYLRNINSGRVEAKKQEREDWLILLAFNHLFAGLEAYVSAHLWDFPGDIKVRAEPGKVTARLSIPLR